MFLFLLNKNSRNSKEWKHRIYNGVYLHKFQYLVCSCIVWFADLVTFLFGTRTLEMHLRYSAVDEIPLLPSGVQKYKATWAERKVSEQCSFCVLLRKQENWEEELGKLMVLVQLGEQGYCCLQGLHCGEAMSFQHLSRDQHSQNSARLHTAFTQGTNCTQCSKLWANHSIFGILIVFHCWRVWLCSLDLFHWVLVYSFATACLELAPWKSLSLTLTLCFRDCHFPGILSLLPCSGESRSSLTENSSLRKSKAVFINLFLCWCFPSFLLLDKTFGQLTHSGFG